jgi:hypothetical protein
MKAPKWPAWPPPGLSVERAEQLRDLFSPASVVYRVRESEPARTLAELKATFRELRILQRYLDAEGRVRSAVSKKPGKVPSFKFGSNDGWHVIPEECLIMASRLTAYVAEQEASQTSAGSGAGRPVMRLMAPDSQDIEEPSPEQVVAAIERLDHTDDNPFFILQDDSRRNAFMQTIKQSARLFFVEYAEGQPQRQFSTPKVPKGKVKELLLAYLRRDDAFKSLTEWREITEELFGESRREQEWVRGFIAFNELAAKYGGYEVW